MYEGMNILIGTEVEVYVSAPPNPSDGDYSHESTDGRVTNVWACFTEDSTRTWGDSIIMEAPEGFEDGGTLFAVVADYSSGDTFGTSGGHSQVLDAFINSDTAEALAAKALEHKKDGWRVEYEYDFKFLNKKYHRQWAGYFEHLNSLDIWEVQVRKYPVDPYRDQNDIYPNDKFGHRVGR